MNFTDLYDQFAFAVYHQCLGVVKNPEDAEDLCQEVFSEVVPVLLEKYRGLKKEELGRILMRSAKNRAIDWLRKANKRTEIAFDDELNGSGVEVVTDVERWLEKVLIELKDSEREVISLRHLLGWSWSEIAQKLCLSEIGARKKESRTMQKLQQKWRGKKEV